MDGEMVASYDSFSHAVIFFWSYMILITAADGIGMGLLSMRDSNFLKMYTYISGSKFPIVFGKILSQLFFLWVNMVILLLFSAIIHQQPVTSLLLTSILILIPIAIPMYFLFVIPAILRVRATSLGPLLTLGVILLVNFSNVHMSTGTALDYVVYLNPATVIVTLSKSVHTFLVDATIDIVWASLIVLIIYFVIGIISYQRLDIISREAR